MNGAAKEAGDGTEHLARDPTRRPPDGRALLLDLGREALLDLAVHPAGRAAAEWAVHAYTLSFAVLNRGSSISSGRPSAPATPCQCRSEMQMIASHPSLAW